MFGHDETNGQGAGGQQGQGMIQGMPMNGGLGMPMTDNQPQSPTASLPSPDVGDPQGASTNEGGDDMSSYQAGPSIVQAGRDTTGNTPEELITIKQEALQSLKPLVVHLDQSPEETFRTAMMMIQAADDQSLIPHAYEAAKQITDDKARAQALLDVVNEINYFTSQNSKS